ncbi:unnamed protein product [Clavelina lepadiformis]|uniref:Methyltransferase type 11 domain-containing protein n=1 Tax=Clavelina lepadiformis TaxID=159417 RepID=A0ABP0F7Y2_CLALP
MDSERIHERECRFSDIVGEISKSMEMNHEFYDKYASKYDDMMKSMGFKIPGHLARLCMENLSDGSKANLAKLTALDVASGTGLAAEALKEAGFCGVIDAIDASLQMNEVAKSKNIYRKMLCHMINVDNRMPFPDNTYGVVVACSALTPGHIEHDCLYVRSSCQLISCLAYLLLILSLMG